MVANILPADPHTQPLGSICPNSTCSEHGPVAYQIKMNHKCSNMVGNILPADSPPCQHWGSKCQNLCQEV